MPVQGVNNTIEPYGYYNKNKKLVSVKQYSDFDEYRYEVPASDGKKAGCALASFFAPGLGQMINGDIKRGTAFSLVTGASILGSLFAGTSLMKRNPAITAITGKPTKTGKAGMAVIATGYLVGIATWLYSIIDAYKTAKDELVEIRPKQKR